MFHDMDVYKGYVRLYGWSGLVEGSGEVVRRGFVPVAKIASVHIDWDKSLVRIFVDGGAPAATISFEKYDDAGGTMATAIEAIEDALEVSE